MAPEIALHELRYLRRGSVVIDPMVGSGVTVRAAATRGHTALGFDLDPLAVRIALAECAHISSSKLKRLSDGILRGLDRMDRRTLGRYPAHFDDETKDYADLWFPRYNQAILAYIAEKIASVEEPILRTILEIALSGTIIVKQSGCSFARDVAHSRPHRWSACPAPAEALFERRMTRLISVYAGRERTVGRVCIAQGDARSLPVKTGRADMVITSPPYLNALDYMRGHRMSLIWLGYNLAALRELRASMIGSENTRGSSIKRASRSETMQQVYADNLRRMLSEVYRVLKQGGKFVCVVGDNKNSGGLSNASVIKKHCKELGLALAAERRRVIPRLQRYLPPPQTTDSSLAGRMVRESILSFRKR